MSAIVAPERSLDQRMAALKTANRIRVERAKLKRAVKAGEVSAVEVLANPEWWVMTMKVELLLRSLPKFGGVKTVAVMRACLISPTKTIGGLSSRQRGALIHKLEARP